MTCDNFYICVKGMSEDNFFHIGIYQKHYFEKWNLF